MSRSTWDMGCRPMGGLYRDRENGWIFGVCAGIADYANFQTPTVRLIAVICLLLFFWPTVLAYLVAVALFREKPLIYAGREHESDFWKPGTAGNHWRQS